MWLKTLIVMLLILLLISLGSGFFFLMKDDGRSRRVLHSLGVRVTLAALLVALVAFGVLTGRLGSRAPWDEALDHKLPPGLQPTPTR
jgi:hypothetical protein